MTRAALGVIKKSMADMDLKYMLKEYKVGPSEGKLPDIYFIGEYQEVESVTEDGMDETAFMITGFSRIGIAALEEAKEKIEKCFPRKEGKVTETATGSVVAVFYADCFNNLPTGNTEITKMQINLLIKEWKV